MRFVKGTTATTDLTAGDGTQRILVEITWDEAVTVSGSPQVVVANGNQSGGGYGNHTLTYTATGSTANRKRFTVASQTLVEDDVLSIGTALHDAVALNGGTIKDTASGSINAQRNLLAAVRVTHTVTA